MKIRIGPFLFLLVLVAVQPAQTATVYWDINGSNVGAGGATPAGAWGSLTSSATNKSSFFTSNGILNVTVIPEPSMLILLANGALVMLARRRRSRNGTV